MGMLLMGMLLMGMLLMQPHPYRPVPLREVPEELGRVIKLCLRLTLFQAVLMKGFDGT